MAATVLADAGYLVETARDADEAVQIMQEKLAHVVFTDIVMPGTMNGFEFAEWVKRTRPGLPVVCTSGYAAVTSGSQAACDHFIRKPYQLAAVLVLFQSLLR